MLRGYDPVKEKHAVRGSLGRGRAPADFCAFAARGPSALVFFKTPHVTRNAANFDPFFQNCRPLRKKVGPNQREKLTQNYVPRLVSKNHLPLNF